MNWANLLKDIEVVLTIFDKLNGAGLIKVKEQPTIDVIGQIVTGLIAQHIATQP